VPGRTPLAQPVERLAVARVLVDSGRDVEAVAHGGSMGRAIPAGATIRIRGVDPESLRVGDVIAFAQRETLVTHRVVARGRGRQARSYLVTRGDAARTCDEPVAMETVLGIVRSYQSGGHWYDVPGPVRHAGWSRLLTSLVESAVRAALELDARLAGALVRLTRRAGSARARVVRLIRGRVP